MKILSSIALVLAALMSFNAARITHNAHTLMQNADTLTENARALTRHAGAIQYSPLPGFGEDGYGYCHLRKEDHDFIEDVLKRIDPSVWDRRPLVFEDMTVTTEDGTEKSLSCEEVYEILKKDSAIKSVSVAPGRPRPLFDPAQLAFPQYEKYYQLSPEQWRSLQDLCRLKLIDPIAADEVKAHWQSIVDGTPPFGLKVHDGK